MLSCQKQLQPYYSFLTPNRTCETAAVMLSEGCRPQCDHKVLDLTDRC